MIGSILLMDYLIQSWVPGLKKKVNFLKQGCSLPASVTFQGPGQGSRCLRICSDTHDLYLQPGLAPSLYLACFIR